MRQCVYESSTYEWHTLVPQGAIWDSYFCASFLSSLCTELVRNGNTEVFEVLSAGLSTGVHEVLSAHTGFPQEHFAPAFAAPLKGWDVGLDDHAIDGQVGVLFHGDSPMVGQCVPRGSARRRFAPTTHAVHGLGECPIADDTYGAQSADGASRLRLTTQAQLGCSRCGWYGVVSFDSPSSGQDRPHNAPLWDAL